LLSNAIKFGRGRPISVLCSPTEHGGVQVEVIDQGEGISTEDQERIFHEFVQLGKTQLQDGTGLGLPISRRLAEILGGELSVDSTPGNGATFRLSLPASVAARSPLRLVDQEMPRETTDERQPADGGERAERDRRVASVGDAVRS
jgi:signal transduction histidine kinase